MRLGSAPSALVRSISPLAMSHPPSAYVGGAEIECDYRANSQWFTFVRVRTILPRAIRMLGRNYWDRVWHELTGSKGDAIGRCGLFPTNGNVSYYKIEQHPLQKLLVLASVARDLSTSAAAHSPHAHRTS